MINLETPFFGHRKMNVGIDTRYQTIQLDDRELAYESTGFEKPPKGVESIETLEFRDKELAQFMNMAIITLAVGGRIPIQKFRGPRIFVDYLMSGEDAYFLSYNQKTRESMSYAPATTYGMDEGRHRGVAVYGLGMTTRWFNRGSKPMQILEFCLPPYEPDNTIVEPGRLPRPAKVMSQLNKLLKRKKV